MDNIGHLEESRRGQRVVVGMCGGADIRTRMAMLAWSLMGRTDRIQTAMNFQYQCLSSSHLYIHVVLFRLPLSCPSVNHVSQASALAFSLLLCLLFILSHAPPPPSLAPLSLPCPSCPLPQPSTLVLVRGSASGIGDSPNGAQTTPATAAQASQPRYSNSN